jgi:hypothetical protein
LRATSPARSCSSNRVASGRCTSGSSGDERRTRSDLMEDRGDRKSAVRCGP